MKVLAYWGARTGIFFVVLIALWSVGWRDILAVIAAVIVGWLISYLALPAMRARANAQMDSWVTRSHDRQHSEDLVEDAEAESLAGEATGTTDTGDSAVEADAPDAPDTTDAAVGAEPVEDQNKAL